MMILIFAMNIEGSIGCRRCFKVVETLDAIDDHGSDPTQHEYADNDEAQSAKIVI
ncbi:MAG: hypothetical protein JO313_07320 [Verrucomicrobia bacterium]|nr:hypothetical protein [Verrucomicrobiota bacterium]